MRGMLKTKSPGSQILLVIGICLASFFILGLIGTIILSGMTGMNIVEISDTVNWDFSKPEVLTLVRGMQVVQFISLFIVPTWICTKLLSTDSSEYLGLKNPKLNYLVAGIAAMFICIPFVNWMGELNRLIHFPPDIEAWMKAKEDEAALTIKGLLSRHTVKDLFLNLFFIAVLAAVGEELLFRGLLQRLFIKLFKSPLAGIIITAFLFSAMHLQFYGFLPRFLLGVILGLVYWYSGSLWVAIIAHFIYDAVLIILAYFYPEMLKDETTVQIANMVLLGSISLVATMALILWMKANSKTSYQVVYANDAIPVKDDPF